MQNSRILLAATIALLAACSKDSTSPGGGVSGSLSFTYTGGGGGSYSASGSLTAAASASTQQTTPWAVGWKDSRDNSFDVGANVPTTGGLSNVAAVTTNGQTAGTYTINPNCSSTTTVSCTGVFLLVGTSATNGSDSFQFVCSLTSGSVVVSTLSSTATGTFSGTGTCFTATGGSSAFAVTNGSFNVGVLSSVPTGF